jgi:hypothetical protein
MGARTGLSWAGGNAQQAHQRADDDEWWRSAGLRRQAAVR